MKEKLINIGRLLFGFVCFFYISVIAGFVLYLFDINTKELSIGKLVIIEFIMSAIMFLFLMLLYHSFIKKDFNDFKKNLNKNIIYIIKVFVIFMIVKYLISVLATILMMAFGYDVSSVTSQNQKLTEDYVRTSPALMVISAAFLVPVYEEILFRMGIKKVVGNKYLFVIISGLLFGLLHVFPLDGIPLGLGVLQSVVYVTMGIFLAYSYQKTDNIFISIGLHFLNNFLSVLAMINMM